jgi:hypothetical protein
MIKQPFYKTFVLYSNILNEFTVESLINVSLESAYRCGQNVLHDESVYGYIIVKIENNSWQVINETVQGCDYTVYEHNGTVHVKEGKDSIVLV